MISIVVISKDEPSLDDTLAVLADQVAGLGEPGKSSLWTMRRLAALMPSGSVTRREVRWMDYQPPPGVRISIPHQRNAGVLASDGDIVVFTDAGCLPDEGWLKRLVAPLRPGEDAVAGTSRDMAGA